MSTEACVFCQIIRGSRSARLVYRDGEVAAFRDIRPVAPVHILIVPIKHIGSLDVVNEDDEALLARLLLLARRLASQEKLSEGGYRVVLNTGPNAGQSVFHLHLHLMGGRRLHWPPG